MLCSHFFGGKLCSLFQVSIALCNPALYLLLARPRRVSASLILTNKGKPVTASKVTTRPKESAPAGKGMETSTRKPLGKASTPKTHVGEPAGSK